MTNTGKNKTQKYYIKIEDEKIYVTEEQARAYMRSRWHDVVQ